jgi:aspartate 1-decarboxylase
MLLRDMMKAKIHGMTVTGRNLNYTGSLGIDSNLLESAGILPYEKIQVVNLANGERMWTYAIRAEPGTGACVLNGGMALKGKEGDRLLVITYVLCDDETARRLRPQVLVISSGDNRKFELRDS